MTLHITLTFSTGVRVGTGIAARGLDEVVDRTDLIRPSSIKGVLRAEARLLLPGATINGTYVDHPFVRSVFGEPRQPSPWHFRVAAQPARIVPQVGIRLDGDGQVAPGALLVKEVAAIDTATLTISRRHPLTTAGLPANAGDPEKYHLALLRVAARLAEKIGQRRTRGLGWVCMTLDEPNAAHGDVDLLWAIKNEASR